MSKIEAVGASEVDQKSPSIAITNAEASGDSSITITFRTNEGIGILYYVVTTLSSQPSTTQIWNGLDSAGSPAEIGGFTRVRKAGGNQTFIITGVPSNIEYFVHLFHRDWAGNDSSVHSTNGITIENLSPLSAPIIDSGSISTTPTTVTFGYTASLSASYQEYRFNSGSVGSIVSNVTDNPVTENSYGFQPGQYTLELRSVENTSPLNFSDWRSQLVNLPSLIENTNSTETLSFIAE